MKTEPSHFLSDGVACNNPLNKSMKTESSHFPSDGVACNNPRNKYMKTESWHILSDGVACNNPRTKSIKTESSHILSDGVACNNPWNKSMKTESLYFVPFSNQCKWSVPHCLWHCNFRYTLISAAWGTTWGDLVDSFYHSMYRGCAKWSYLL